MHFGRLATTLLKDGERAQYNHILASNFAKYLPILFFFTDRLRNKHFLTWLLTTPPYLKCVATLRFDRTIIMAMSLWPHFFGPPYKHKIATVDIVIITHIKYENRQLQFASNHQNVLYTNTLRCTCSVVTVTRVNVL